MRTFHFKPQYNMVGVALLLASALLVFLVSYFKGMSGSINITIPPLILSIFLLGFFTGRPCLTIHKDHFEYRPLPLTRNSIVYLDVVKRVEIQGTEILVYCSGQELPVKIRSHSFRKEQLPEVTDYFSSLNSTLVA